MGQTECSISAQMLAVFVRANDTTVYVISWFATGLRERTLSASFCDPSVFTDPCGSGLAREDGGTFNIDVADPPLSRASPLPQESSSVHRSSVRHRSRIGIQKLQDCWSPAGSNA
ncbi:hypothetical protein DZG01_19100 [Pseudomonas fluorescens]|nr:hypothetical protein DZG01_19100 [Pseudomonas fluorescens]